MLYVLKRADNSVAITTLLPSRAQIGEDVFNVAAIKGTTKTIFLQNVETGDGASVQYDGDVRSLMEDSVPGVTFTFPNIADEIKRMPVPDEYVSFARIQVADIPADREYRNAWTHDGKGVVTHDMDMARGLHRQKMRAARAPKLAGLDIEYQRADEAGDLGEKQAVAVRKQELRDVTDHPGVAAAATVDDLKAVWPDILK